MRPPLTELSQLVEPLNDAELIVARALATLDDDWTVYVQPRIGHDVPDFVAVHDLAGVCAIEVKDWKPGWHHRTADGFIESDLGDGPERRAGGQPRFVASRYRTTIYDQFFALPSDGAETTEAVRSVVALPYLTNTEAMDLLGDPTASPALRKVAVWGGDGIEGQLEQVVRGIGCAHPRADSIRRVKQHLIPSEIVSIRAAPKMNDDVQGVERNRDNDPVRRVRGPAGSGKSVGLTARAARLASEGKRVLVLSFSVTFANRLRALVDERCGEYGANPTLVTCSNFHSFCTRVVQDAEQLGYETRAPKGAGWTRAIVAKTKSAFEAGFEDRFDAIMIDEGQDFTLDWWNLLRNSAVDPKGEMLLVVDPTQDLYEKKAWHDDGLMLDAGFYTPWIELTGSYRMPPDMLKLANEFANEHLDGELLSAAEVLDDQAVGADAQSGSVRKWQNIDDVGTVGRDVGREVVRLLRENPSLAPRDVAFLCEYHHDGVAAVNEIESAGYEVHHIFSRNPDDARRKRKYRFWLDADGVKGCTVHSFKGWEVPALVMGIGVETRSKRIAYVAMTRLKARPDGNPSFLSVVNADKQIADFRTTFESAAPAPGPASIPQALASPASPATPAPAAPTPVAQAPTAPAPAPAALTPPAQAPNAPTPAASTPGAAAPEDPLPVETRPASQPPAGAPAPRSDPPAPTPNEPVPNEPAVAAETVEPSTTEPARTTGAEPARTSVAPVAQTTAPSTSSSATRTTTSTRQPGVASAANGSMSPADKALAARRVAMQALRARANVAAAVRKAQATALAPTFAPPTPAAPPWSPPKPDMKLD